MTRAGITITVTVAVVVSTASFGIAQHPEQGRVPPEEIGHGTLLLRTADGGVRSAPNQDAVAVLTVDSAIPDAVIAELLELPFIMNAKLLEL